MEIPEPNKHVLLVVTRTGEQLTDYHYLKPLAKWCLNKAPTKAMNLTNCDSSSDFVERRIFQHVFV